MKATTRKATIRIKEVPAAQFKTKCLQIVDQVMETHEPVLILKDGKPVARLVPEVPKAKPVMDRYKGTFTSHGDLTKPAFSEEDWECLK